MKFLAILLVIICSTIHLAIAQKTGVVGPHLLVYKMKKDYHKLVPVVLSEDRSKIISYPDPHDLKTGGKRLLPSSLHNGYFMDNAGVGVNTAFLKINYTEYANLKTAPSVEDLYKMIVDKNPLTALYDCGIKSTFKEPVSKLNQLIDKKQLQKNCKALKTP